MFFSYFLHKTYTLSSPAHHKQEKKSSKPAIAKGELEKHYKKRLLRSHGCNTYVMFLACGSI